MSAASLELRDAILCRTAATSMEAPRLHPPFLHDEEDGGRPPCELPAKILRGTGLMMLAMGVILAISGPPCYMAWWRHLRELPRLHPTWRRLDEEDDGCHSSKLCVALLRVKR